MALTTTLNRQLRDATAVTSELRDLCLAFDGVLRTALPYQVAAWATHDPATGLTTSCTLSGIPEDHSREASIFRCEFREDEPSTYLGLISDHATVAVLSDETGGDLTKAGRYREVFAAFGMSDELRAILWADDHAWGSVSLYRVDGTTFAAREAELVEELSPTLAEGLRLGMLRTAAQRPRAVEDPPGIVTVGLDGAVAPATEPAEHWLDIGGPPLLTAARVAASALRERDEWAGATSRVVTDQGRVLTLHAAPTVAEDDAVAVIVEAARPAEVAAMLVDAYGLTHRQREVLGLLLLGHSMTQIARGLGISEHTANDHRKAIYRQVGVSSRSELAGLLQAEQYDPRSRAGATPGPYGGYLVD